MKESWMKKNECFWFTDFIRSLDPFCLEEKRRMWKMSCQKRLNMLSRWSSQHGRKLYTTTSLLHRQDSCWTRIIRESLYKEVILRRQSSWWTMSLCSRERSVIIPIHSWTHLHNLKRWWGLRGNLSCWTE